MFNAKHGNKTFGERRTVESMKQFFEEVKSELADGANPFLAIRSINEREEVRELIGNAYPPALFAALICGEVPLAKVLFEQCKLRPATKKDLVNKIWDLRGVKQAQSLLATAIGGKFTYLDLELGSKRQGRTALDAVKFALSIGCDPNGPTFAATMQIQEQATGESHRFARQDQQQLLAEVAREHNRKQADPSFVKSSNYFRPLHVLMLTTGGPFWEPNLALECGKLLVEAGADVNATCGTGDTVLTIAISSHMTQTKDLEARGVSAKEARRDMFDVVEAVRLALKLGADPNLPVAQPKHMERALDMIAGAMPHDLALKIARLLFEHGADFSPLPFTLLSAGKAHEYDYLRIAIETGNEPLIRFILEKAGVDPNVKLGGEGFPTLLGYAVSYGDDDIVRTVLEFGGDPFARSGSNPSFDAIETAEMKLEHARMNGCRYDAEVTEFEKVRRRYGAGMLGTIKGRTEILKMLENKAEEMKKSPAAES